MLQPHQFPAAWPPVSLAPDSRPRMWSQHRHTNSDWHTSQPEGWSTSGSLSSPGLCFLTNKTAIVVLILPLSPGCSAGPTAKHREDCEQAAGPALLQGRTSLCTAHGQLSPLWQGMSVQMGVQERVRAGWSRGWRASPTSTRWRGVIWRAQFHVLLGGKRAWDVMKPHPSGQTLTIGRMGWLDFRGCGPQTPWGGCNGRL